MEVKEMRVNDKQVFIVDNALSVTQQDTMHNVCVESPYTISRTQTIQQSDVKLSLKSEFNIVGILNCGLFDGHQIRQFLHTNKLKVFRAYTVLGVPSDIYKYHIDSRSEGDFTLLYYANKTWHPEWEGETHFGSDDMTEIELSVTAKPNRMVLFDSRIPHKSSQASTAAEELRMVHVVKLVTDNSEMQGADINDFYFKSYQPEISQFEQTVIDTVKEKTKGVEHSQGMLFDHLYGVYTILKKFGASQDLCLAGLCHSVNGTQVFNHVNLEIDLPKLIGNKAADIVAKFAGTYRTSPDAESDLAMLLLEYANDIEQSWRIDVPLDKLTWYRKRIKQFQ